MKSVLRLFVWVLALLLLLTGCAPLHGCFDTADVSAAEKQAKLDALLSARPASGSINAPALSVTMIDVGQGDSILLVSPEGRTMLVDAGPSDAFSNISDELQKRGVSSLDVVVATHPHDDHIGSMASVLDAYPVGAFYTIAEDLPTDACIAMRAALERNGCPVSFAEAGMTIPWAESCTVTVLNPIASYADAETEMNDLSVVLHVRYGDTAVLLTGDAEEKAENRMLDTLPASMLRADVLKLGHHGSSTSTSAAFFLAVDPDYAVASCGKDNDYGHPHYETLSLLYDTDTAFYGTDMDGSVTFQLDGETVAVETSRKETP
ncbi:MAG: MBL fold metallo-hydrolase [Clostridia bacterium]|nr:MBL fold metallo-hydrolase [Clostridia bacterium]